MFNIISEAVIRMHTRTGSQEISSLPGVYAALMQDEVEAFPSLRPHQRHAWHAFLVQLGAMAIHRAGVGELPADSAQWADLIRGLTLDYPEDEPWQLVVDDITKSAFMQPPARSKERETDYKSTVATPDELDMLVTSKNHDLKSVMATRASADDWIFALITLQTMEGFGGAGNYGISRMNGGLGSRPAFTLAPSEGPGAHARRDITALLEYRPILLAEFPMTDAAGRVYCGRRPGTAPLRNLYQPTSWNPSTLKCAAASDCAPIQTAPCMESEPAPKRPALRERTSRDVPATRGFPSTQKGMACP